jgi:voltage-gated potassium channel
VLTGRSAQAALVVVAALYDIFCKVARKGARNRSLASDEKYTWGGVAFDLLMMATAFSSCLTFVLRSYESTEVPLPPWARTVVNIVDLAGSCVFVLRYALRSYSSPSKVGFVMSPSAILDVLSIVSVLGVAIKADLWLPFTFLRVLTVSVTMKRVVTAMDFPEIAEQLAVTVVDFFAMVFVFAGIFFMLENLGNIPWQDPQQDTFMNLSFFDSVWFVFVTVSTVGYGDFSPRSILGQLAGGGMILIGVIFFGSKTSEISAIYRQVIQGFFVGDVGFFCGRCRVLLWAM